MARSTWTERDIPDLAGAFRNWRHVRPRRGAGPTLRAAEKHRDTRRGGADPELPQLAFDPQVSPPGVLPRHHKDQRADLRIDRGAPGRAMRPRPLPRDE